jgi:probable phosphoglycerate mutase
MSAVLELILIRHGRPNRVEGVSRPDPGLADAGLAQAQAVADTLAALPIREIISSGLARARQTAQPTADKHGLTVNVDVDLAELDLGADYYIPIEELRDDDPRLLEWRAALVEPETQQIVNMFRNRVLAAVERITYRMESGLVAVFCHGGVIDTCVDRATGGWTANRRDPDYGSLTRIELSAGGRWKLRTYNEIQHVAALLPH